MVTARVAVRLLGMVCAIVLLTVAGWGQATSGEITGQVKDSTGAVIPGVEVIATNVDTGVARNALTESSGMYRIPLLNPGSYSVKASLTGFKTSLREGITVTVAQVVRVDLTLEVGSISETVTVSGEASLVNTEQGRVSDLVDSKQVVDMPLNGRNIYQLMQLAPGAVNATTITEPGAGGATGTASTSVNGGRVNFNGYWVDGITNKGLSGGTNGFAPSADTIQEFRMETLNFSAEFGDSAGSVVNVVSKSGTNNFHGTAYEFLRNDHLDAREFFDIGPASENGGKPAFKQNQYGATFGGPIHKNTTFFFASFEGLNIRTGQSQSTAFQSSQWTNFVKQYGKPVAKFLYNSFPTPTPTNISSNVGGYLADQGLIPDSSQASVDSYLSSNFGSPAGALLATDPMVGNISFFNPQPTDATQASIRIDQEFRGGKDKIFGRYNHDHQTSLIQSPTTALPEFQAPTDNTAHQVAISETHIFSPKVVNEFRAGLNRTINDIGAGTPGVPQIIDTGTLTSGFGAYSGYPQIFHENVFNYSDVVSITKGKHGMKMGMEYRRNQENSDFNVGRPEYYFYNLATLALDSPYYQIGGVDPHILDGTHQAELSSNGRGWRTREFGAFFNDDWKIRPNLTLNLGVRYDVYTRHKEVQNRTTTFDMSNGTSLFERLKNGDFKVTDVLSEPDYNNFAPRIGFAWDPFSNGKMSVRGGFGMAYQSGIFNPLSNSRWNPPFYSFNLICDISACGDPSQRVLYGPQTPGEAVTATGPDPNIGAHKYEGNIIAYDPSNKNSTYLTGIANPYMRDPYVMSWFFGIQKELARDLTLEVNYVGTGGRKLIRAQDWNRFNGDRTGACDPNGDYCGDTSLNRINQLYGRMRFWENSANSSYNALQTQVTKRFTHGYAITGNYTWAKSMDVRSTWHSGATSSNGAQEGYSTDVNDIKLDWGRSVFDARHRGVVNFIWELPFLKNSSGFVKEAFGGWQFNGIVSLQSGQPFTPFCSLSYSRGCDFNADGANNDRPNTPSSGNTVSSSRSSWVNAAAGPFKIPTSSDTGIPSTTEKLAFFGTPTAPADGNLGRNTFEGPGFANTDFSVFKNFKIAKLTEDSKLQFRAEFFNIFNRVNFHQPLNTINDTQFGTAIATFAARQIQFGLKLIF